ncbi:MAG: TonB-denpendent receptor, partial [Rhodobacter sp. CACIA14H1]
PLPRERQWTQSRLLRAVNAYVRDGFLPPTVLDRASRRETDDRLPAIVAAIKGADPDITLQAICTRLEAMRERTPRGRTSWQPSSVKMLLERAERLGLLE